MSAKRAFARSKLPEHPLVTDAFSALVAGAGLESGEAQAALAGASAYTRMAADPQPDVAAALLLITAPMLPSEVDPRAIAMAAGLRGFMEDGTPQLVRDAKVADMMLGGVIASCALYRHEVESRRSYMYENMLARAVQQREIVEAMTALSQSPGLVIAARRALDDFEMAMHRRAETARDVTDFALTGLPDDPMVRKAYDTMRGFLLRRHPHDPDVVAHVAQIAWEVFVGQTPFDPEMVAAALLHENVIDDPAALAAAFSPRVAELFVDSARYGGRIRGKVTVAPENNKSGAVIRTAAAAVTLNRALSVYTDARLQMPPADRSNFEAEIRRLSTRLGSYIAEGKLPPLMEDRAGRLGMAARDLLEEQAPPVKAPRRAKPSP